ncbi:disrupted in renal carcinoma protein 2 homolog [Lingula anatina]|uniref:Disrupted in renal carcinoma protein 2 homolog n=1 Tax=Lingula anatina TaxID=7574 RepID=A0A1S3I8C7_LINAN|nr:disrupted in renal carcinoma protein 2 homolog [Lingula anatina]|eukprot:XP_013394520.1 disrupted in renal carcinoma protein 2 homolog [Lingula anatina]
MSLDDKEPLVREPTSADCDSQDTAPDIIQPGITSINTEVANQHSYNSKDGSTEYNGVVYKRRWYILIMFCLLTFTQGGIWNTWGPVTTSAKYAFGWNDGDIDLLSNWGPITFVLSTFIFTWLMDVKGLRWACVITMALVAVGSALRCITTEPVAATWLIHAGQLLNGIGGPVAMAAGPLLSNAWFPVAHRTSVTACTATANVLGIAVTFIIGPLMIRAPPSAENCTLSSINCSCFANSSCEPSKADVASDILLLMYIEAGWSIAIFLLMVVYFPSKPPTPPTASASTIRVDHNAGLVALLKNHRVWMVAVPYSVCGVYAVWTSVLGVNLEGRVSEVEAGWLGFWASVAGMIAALILARFADIFAGHLKKLLLLLLLGAIGSFVWFAVLVAGLVPSDSPGWTVMLYTSYILGGIFETGSTAFFYEIACEASFPTAEGVTTGFLTFLNNVCGLVFLFIFMIPNVDKKFMNWVLIGSTTAVVPVVILYKERYTRLDLDTQIEHKG